MEATPVRQANYAGADGAVGIVFLIFGTLGMICTVLLSAVVISVVQGLTGAQPTMTIGPDGFSAQQPNNMVALLPSLGLGFVFCLFALMAAAGSGMRLSRGWAFSLGIVLCGLMIPAGSGWAVFGVAGAVFCVFRRIL